MNRAIVFHYLARAMLIGSALFAVPALVSLIYHEYFCMLVFLAVGAVVALLSLPLALILPKDRRMFAREGMVIAALLWVLFLLWVLCPFMSAVGFRISAMRYLRVFPVLPQRVLPF